MLSYTWVIRIIGLLGCLLCTDNAAGQPDVKVADELLSIHDIARFAPHRSASRLGILLEKTSNFDLPLRGNILIELSNSKFFMGDKLEALRIAKDAEMLGIRSANKPLLGKSLLAQAYAVSKSYDEPSSRTLVQRAKDLADGTDDIALKVQASISLGESMIEAGNYSKGMTLIDSALALAEISGDVRLKFIALRARAARLAAASDYTNALHETDKLLSEAKKSANAALQARANLTEFSIASQAGDSGRALYALKSAIHFLNVCGGNEALPDNLISLSDIYLQRKNYFSALETSRQALKLALKYSNKESANSAAFNHGIAEIYLKKNKAGRAEVEKSLKHFDDFGLSSSLLEYANALAHSGDTDAALKYYKRAFDHGFSASEKSKQVSYESLQRAYQYEQKRNEIVTLGNQNLQQTVELREQQQQRRLWTALTASSLVILAILTFFAVRSKKKTTVLVRQQQELAIINEKLQWQSDHDSLTGTYNRRFFEEYISSNGMYESLLAQAPKNIRRTGSLFLIDVDHFKKVNDTFGHTFGDVVLREVASRIKSVLRTQDILVRWGGEEFMVFLPEVSNSDSAEMAERMLQAISENFISADSAAIHVTVSAGYCPVPIISDGVRMSCEVSIKLADAALYFAKQNGRDRAYGIDNPIDLSLSSLAECQANFGAAIAANSIKSRLIERSR